MKKLILVFFVLIPMISGAQSLRFSLHADPEFSWMVPDSKDIKSHGAVAGINAGLGMDYYFAENYAFSTGLFITNNGGKLEYEDTLAFNLNSRIASVPKGNIITYKLQYISIPFGLKFKTNEIGYATFFANPGISPMFNIKGKASDESESLLKDNVGEDIMLLNMSYFINLGVQYSLGGSTAIIGGLGYSSGFVDVTSRAKDKININSVTIKLGILF